MTIRKTIAASLLGCLACGAAWGQEVTLQSADGAVDVSGALVAFDGDTYVVRTGLGELRVDADGVTCTGEACPDPGEAGPVADVTFAGSDTVGLGMMPLLLEGYAGAQTAEIVFDGPADALTAELIGDDGFGDPLGTLFVSSTTSGRGFDALMAGGTDIAMASRRIRPAEARALRDAGAGNMVHPDQEHVIAADSLVVIVHPRNPIERITMDQLADVFSGLITNWSDLGGEDAPITVFGRPEGSGTRAVFETIVFDGAEVPLPPGAVVQDDNVAMAAAVNDDPTAIGFVSYAFQRGARAVPLVTSCELVAVPTAFAARTEEYPLQRRLYMYNRADATSPAAQAFLDYTQSEAADGVIAKSGFIDLGVDRQPQPVESARGQMLLTTDADPYEGGIMREMLGLMVDYDRLSTTFRFRTGSARLDERGILDKRRLARFLQGVPAGSEVLFVGFTDEVGAFDSNRALSRERAEQVQGELEALGVPGLEDLTLSAEGFGEIAPSACNTDEVGRRINRRVEVWIRDAEG
ncbi:phosphate ABC transporter substrate-binding/OmpA family protein [Jannaschia sp. LMIT008]|uniref:phosphate ABC transporter substrate-binding/OmpA family protein n=1 Tax=Jannaschia maritima TaxID=3032585 RepID=UPI002812202D|nr:phosphate ABC transporter substrate-binding/OmpA family protein [Jannaschia sp. LMIT008]